MRNKITNGHSFIEIAELKNYPQVLLFCLLPMSELNLTLNLKKNCKPFGNKSEIRNRESPSVFKKFQI